MHEAKTRLSQLVERAEAGEEVIIARHGEPVARLVPVPKTSSIAELHGVLAGKVRIAEDFDELPEELSESFGLQ